MQQDQFHRLLPTFIQIIELTEQEESEYWAVVSAVLRANLLRLLCLIQAAQIDGGLIL